MSASASTQSTTAPAAGADVTTIFGLSPNAAFGLGLSVVGILCLFVGVVTGSIVAAFVFLLLSVLAAMVALHYGIVTLPGALLPKTPAVNPAGTPASLPANVIQKGSEVFHIADARFTYEEAPAVCAAYGSQLASLEQIIDAYNHGAEWCGYGWSEGGMALYPTQKATWDILQKDPDNAKRTACGRPGVNGGYFDPATKFGVNCFGFKPDGAATFPQPVPGSDPAAFSALVSRFKNMMSSFTLDTYNRNQWSAQDSTVGGQVANYGNQFAQSATNFINPGNGSSAQAAGNSYAEHFTEHGNPLSENLPGQTSAASVAAPYGLVGAMGPTGAAGTPGSEGPTGPASTVPGPTGPAGTPGAQGLMGPASTVPGPAGPTGPQGAQGAQGIPGAAAAAGATGPRGPTGPQGTPGMNGAPGTPGAPGAPAPKGRIVNAIYGAKFWVGGNSPWRISSKDVTGPITQAVNTGTGINSLDDIPPFGDPVSGQNKTLVIDYMDKNGQMQNYQKEGNVFSASDSQTIRANML